MAKTSIRNISTGPRGVYDADGNLVMLERGETAEIDISAAERKDAEASGYFLLGDSAEKDDIGALKKVDLIAIADAEGVAYEADDNRSDLIAKIEAARA